MGIVLVILALAILLIIAIVRAILKQDDNEPPCPDAERPDAEYPELQLHGGTRHEPGQKIELHSREPEQEYKTKPPPPNKITYPFDYNAPWWRDHSHRVREQKNWQCDECGISLKDNHEMLHIHHAKGIRRNTFADLQALCIGCHAEQPGKNHRQIKKKRTYKRFMERFGEQWCSYREAR